MKRDRAKPNLPKLIRLARRASPTSASPDPESNLATAPFGFAARVAATWCHTESGQLSPADVWERLAWSGCGLAVAACLLVLVLRPVAPEPNGFDLLVGAPATQFTF